MNAPIVMKRCSRCNYLRHLSMFRQEESYRNGRLPHCKLCQQGTRGNKGEKDHEVEGDAVSQAYEDGYDFGVRSSVSELSTHLIRAVAHLGLSAVDVLNIREEITKKRDELLPKKEG